VHGFCLYPKNSAWILQQKDISSELEKKVHTTLEIIAIQLIGGEKAKQE